MSVLQASRHAFLATAMTFIREFIFLASYFFAAMISMTAIYWALDLTTLISLFIVMGLMIYAVKLIIRDLDLPENNAVKTE
ncbi:MAG: hypothetical protein MJZ21_05480 [archaeon]|nr:hypothetical protein [archaeon]